MAKLPSVEINPQFITFTHVTMESNKYTCVQETMSQNSIVIIDMSVLNQRRLCTYESKLPNPCFERWPMSSVATCALLLLVLLLGSFVSPSTTSPAVSRLPRSTVFFSNRRTNCPRALFWFFLCLTIKITSNSSNI
ncbi:uncharacterized protein LOC112192216 [Rosa chinensis]|uniref:uncharacterized protein LOC112192216 n=1 Tax=Rosa chinensis TaxID=74649 RepID=UPI000D086996|nr:uncharacterized protein LOC112192216 [Rosa chinensis]XP_024187637.1 uncharacterized protein LOC112192216 [Rosa chinensis]XP_024187638.1 uncharacterized protein LOC112192216 [Rosa chinensis]